MAEKPTNEDIGALFDTIKDDEPVQEEAVLQQDEPEDIPDEEQAEEVSAEELDDVEASGEEDTQEGEEDTQSEDIVEVEWDGQLFEAPKAIADALMRQQDYTQKTQEVAAQRKTYEVAAQQVEEMQKAYAFAQEAQNFNLEIQQADALIGQWEQHLSQNVKELSANDIAAAQLEIKNIERYKAQKEQELNSKQQEFQQAQEQSLRELLDKGTEVLRSRIPGWGESHIAAAKEGGRAIGFTEQELSNVVDPRQVEVLWKAAQYDKLQTGKAAAVKKAENKPTIKSKARNPMPQDVKDKLALRKKLKSNKLSSAQKQAAFAEDIGNRWG